MVRTALYNRHLSYGGKMVEFAGFEMPIEYSGIVDEHITVREKVGVFDVSHMGEIWVKGSNALPFIQKVTTNDASILEEGKAQYSCLPNGNGGIVDDVLVYRYGSEKYLIVVNASNIEKDWNWLNSQNDLDAILENSSSSISQLAVQGPKAIDTLQNLTPINLREIPYYSFLVGELAGIPDVIISNTGYTGAGGFELYVYNSDVTKLWDAIFSAGKAFGIKPIGLGARDTLRLEMGFCLYGNDIDDRTSPIEAGLGWITKFTDEKQFVDKDLLFKQKIDGVAKRLIAFEMVDRGIPRHGYSIYNDTDDVVGVVTSGTSSPVLKKGIGMGYIEVFNSDVGNEIFIGVRNRKLKAKIVKVPFI